MNNPVDWVDWQVFLNWTKKFWEGEYIGLYSPSFYLFFTPFLFLPPEIGFPLYMFILLICYVLALKRSSVLWVFSVPFLKAFLVGQVDFIFLWLSKTKNPIAMAFMTLKPQLFLITLQNWPRFKVKDYLIFLVTFVIIYLPSFLLLENWLELYVRNLGGAERYETLVKIIFWIIQNPIIVLIIIPIGLLLNKNNWYYLIGVALTGMIMPYNYIMYANKKNLFIIPLSWLCVYLQDPKGENQIIYWALIPIALFIFSGVEHLVKKYYCRLDEFAIGFWRIGERNMK